VLTKRTRHIALYFVLGTLLLNICIPVFRGTEPPEALYALLGTIATYLLIGDKEKGKKKDDEGDGEGDDDVPDAPPDPSPQAAK